MKGARAGVAGTPLNRGAGDGGGCTQGRRASPARLQRPSRACCTIMSGPCLRGARHASA